MPRSGRSRSRGPRSASVGVSVASPASAFELDYERKIANFLATAPGQEISLRGVGKVWPRGAVGRLIAFLQARPHRFAVVPGENATVRLLSRSDCGRQNDGNGRTAAPPAPAAAPASAAAAAAAEYALALIAALREAEAAGAGPDGDGALKLCQLGEVCLKPPGVAGADPTQRAAPTSADITCASLSTSFPFSGAHLLSVINNPPGPQSCLSLSPPSVQGR